MQVIYLESIPRKHWLEGGEVRREGKEATTACDNKCVTTVGYWGTLRDGEEHILELSHWWDEKTGVFLHQLPICHCLNGASGDIKSLALPRALDMIAVSSLGCVEG